MSEHIVTEALQHINIYKETVGILIALSGFGGYMFGLKHGRQQTEEKIKPLRELIEEVRRSQKRSDEACRRELECLKQMYSDVRDHNMRLEKDLRSTVNSVCPSINDKD